jgi:hypothetical protein
MCEESEISPGIARGRTEAVGSQFAGMCEESEISEISPDLLETGLRLWVPSFQECAKKAR